MSQIKLNIDGQEVFAEEGETLLRIARANNIFIPAICYLERCSPTLACRLCLVEADGKQVYSCNAKAKDGMKVLTTTPNIKEERKAIMEVYDVNHPLECGVCDQSGECELQNYTLLEEVDNQRYATKDTYKPVKNWGFIQYDPALCIVCEKCVTVCKDMIGDSALKTVSRDSEALDKNYKETMPKDAYAMWNKLNKSLIGTSSGTSLDCTNCGECTSVCPVGALISRDFKYSSNAWELEKIPSTCAHCSVGCQIYYEKKHIDISNSDEKIYRVSNESHFTTLCGAGRYGFDFQNNGNGRDKLALKRAVESVKSAGTIIFNSQITNEEALILQKLKEKLGLKLINHEAYKYAEFMRIYSDITGKSLYSGDLNYIRSCDFIISVGSAIKTDSPNSRFAINNAIKMNKGSALYFHAIGDPVLESIKGIVQIKSKPYSEEQILSYILKRFGKNLPENISKYLANINFNDVNFPDNFETTLDTMLKKKSRFGLIIGADLYSSSQAYNLAELVGLIEIYSDFKTVLIPSDTNTLGVINICKLDKNANNNSKKIGYNEKGDFNISAFGDGDFNIPALNQQEGTFLNIDKRVVPLNVALNFNGFSLNDIANEILDEIQENTINYTSQLFNKIEFDKLSNEFSNSGEDLRGYLISVNNVTKREATCHLAQSDKIKIQGKSIYLANPILQFNRFTAKAHQLQENGGLYLSPEYAKELGVINGNNVLVATKNGNITISAIIDNKISGDIAILPTFDSKIDSRKLFDGYRFIEAKISKV
jgi:NADH-quinone oxidoreductase subunit G